MPDHHRSVGLVVTRWLTKQLAGTSLYVLLLAVGVGVGGGYGAIVFRWLIARVHDLAFGGEVGVAALSSMPWYAVMFPLVVGGGLVAALVRGVSSEVRGHGVPEVIDSVSRYGGRIRYRVAIVKTVASAISIGVGAAVGREGPIVQIGSSLGSTLGQLLHLDTRSIKTLVAAGAAAGIAATFNAPIAGAIFSLEVILGAGNIRSFTPLVVSSVMATAIARHHLGNTPAFAIPAYTFEGITELILFAILGCVASVVALLYSRGVYLVEDAWERLPGPAALRPVAAALAVGLLALFVPEVMGVGYETIEGVLSGQSVPAASFLLALMAAKMLATQVSLAGGFSGGVFAPSLFIGTMLGAAFGVTASAAMPSALAGSPGAYALVGMAAVAAGATHAPITIILIAVEMTGDYGMILPLMLATFLSSALAHRFGPESIYTLKLSRRGGRKHLIAHDEIMSDTPVSYLLRPPGTVVEPGAALKRVIDAVLAAGNAPVYVVAPHGRFVGLVQLEDVSAVVDDQEGMQYLLVAADLVRPAPATLAAETPLAEALAYLGHNPLAELPVIDAERHLVGVIRQRDLLAYYDTEVLRDSTARLTFRDDGFGGRGRTTSLELPDGEDTTDITVPPQWIGRSLRDLDLRAAWGVQVIAIRRGNGQSWRSEVPNPAAPLAEGDVLLVSGTADGVSELLESLVVEARKGE